MRSKRTQPAAVLSRRDYAAKWDVSVQAIDKAIRVGTVVLSEDGRGIDVAWSDQIWGQRHRLRTGAVPMDPVWAARMDAELEQLRRDLGPLELSSAPEPGELDRLRAELARLLAEL